MNFFIYLSSAFIGMVAGYAVGNLTTHNYPNNTCLKTPNGDVLVLEESRHYYVVKYHDVAVGMFNKDDFEKVKAVTAVVKCE